MIQIYSYFRSNITSPFLILLILFISLPSAFSDQCVPSLCPFKCCITKDACAVSEFECNFCDPDSCDGCCNSASENNQSQGLHTLVLAIIAIVAFVLLILIFYLFSSYFSERVRRLRNLRVPAAEKDTIPIVEVQIDGNNGYEKENEERNMSGEEIDDRIFIKNPRKNGQMQVEYKEIEDNDLEDSRVIIEEN